MAIYQIATFGFIKWEGPPPQLVQQHVAKFTKTGQAGISAQLLGVHGDSFEVNLTAVIPTQDQGVFLENGYRFLTGGIQTVLYNNVNYQTQFGHSYLVERVSIESFTRHPLLAGIDYIYPGGWKLRSRWQLTPIV